MHMLAAAIEQPRLSYCQCCGNPLPVDRFSYRRLYCASCRVWVDGEWTRKKLAERRHAQEIEAARFIRVAKYRELACRAVSIIRWENFLEKACIAARALRWARLCLEQPQKVAAIVVHDLRIEKHAGRPRRRSDCLQGGFNCKRPCLYVTCREHLFCNVDPETGVIKYSWPGKEPEELEHTCALDIADEGAHVLENIADKVNMVRERVRQLEIKGLARMRFLMLRNWEKLPRAHGKILAWSFRKTDPTSTTEQGDNRFGGVV